MAIEVTWRLEGEGEPRRTVLVGAGPFRIGRSPDVQVALAHPQISRVHAEISVEEDRVFVSDSNSQNGIELIGKRLTATSQWYAGDELGIGPYRLYWRPAVAGEQRSDLSHMGRQQSERGLQRLRQSAKSIDGARVQRGRFPGPIFEARSVPIDALRKSGRIAEEVDYIAIGGGVGSFIWVDHMRIFGVSAQSIRVLGVAPNKSPYSKWSRLCRNSQIPDHERIRSNSVSTPDNIWGFPGYASRECVRDVSQGRLSGIKYLIQVFGEPAITESYTPKIGDVCRSFDAEARRIGWDDMYRVCQVIGIRKTDDERFVVAYRNLRLDQVAPETQNERSTRERFIVARHLHLATGYPASNYLPDLQAFKQSHPDSTTVVNAYEPHDEVYRRLAQKGGTVLIRGRGIVASRVIQRISEVRQVNKDTRILHLVRRPIREGAKYDLAQRTVRNNVEQQPFNWPKSAWGGTLRKKLEAASPEERARLLASWDGTHTADRADWNDIIERGTRDGWYKMAFGNVASIDERYGRLVTRLENHEQEETVELIADFIIDCTGLVAKLDESPLISDLIRTYDLRRNRSGANGNEESLAGLAVTNNFEIAGLQNGRGRTYGAGVVTGRGPYAGVDSFLGLAYAALRSVDHLHAIGAPSVTKFGPLRSAYQWAKWCVGSPPH